MKHIQTSISGISLAFSFVGLLIPVVALYATKGITILFGIIVLVCLFVLITKKKDRPTCPRALSLSVLALTFWSVASLFWSISTDFNKTIGLSITICMLGGILIIMSLKTLSTNDRIIVCQSTVWGFFFGLSLAFIDVSTDFFISKILHIVLHDKVLTIANLNDTDIRGFVINNGVCLLSLLLWPTLIILHTQKRYLLSCIGFITSAYIISRGYSFAATVAVGVGSVSFLIAYFYPRVVNKIATIGLTLLILGAPFIMKALPDARTIGKDLPELSYSVYPRLVIWQYASNLVMNKPLIGHGIRTSRNLSKTENKITFLYRDNGKIHTGNTEAIPLHPHNGLIQIWLELGAGGAILGLILVLCVLWSINKSQAPQIGKALAFASLASAICLISVSYGLWQSWWLVSLWLQGSIVMLSLFTYRDANSL